MSDFISSQCAQNGFLFVGGNLFQLKLLVRLSQLRSLFQFHLLVTEQDRNNLIIISSNEHSDELQKPISRVLWVGCTIMYTFVFDVAYISRTI